MKTGISVFVDSNEMGARYEEYFAGTGTPGEALLLPPNAASARFETVIVHTPPGFIPPKEAELLVPWLDQNVDIVVGARFFRPSRLSQAGGSGARLWIERFKAAATGLRAGLRDGSSGFYAMRKSTLAALLEADKKIDLARAAERGMSLKEVGVMWIAGGGR